MLLITNKRQWKAFSSDKVIHHAPAHAPTHLFYKSVTRSLHNSLIHNRCLIENIFFDRTNRSCILILCITWTVYSHTAFLIWKYFFRTNKSFLHFYNTWTIFCITKPTNNLNQKLVMQIKLKTCSKTNSVCYKICLVLRIMRLGKTSLDSFETLLFRHIPPSHT